MADVPQDSVEYDLVLVMDATAREHLTAARTLREQAAQMTRAAADELTLAAQTLHSQGLSVRDVGYLLDVSYPTRAAADHASTRTPAGLKRVEQLSLVEGALTPVRGHGVKARTLDLDELAVRAMTEWTISHAPIPANSAPTAKNSHERRTATPTVATARPTMSTGC